jgi:cytochrome c oxidase assembly protein subunit 15
VRATGSGMGCPDWPKCFGSWIPPTSVDQLPAGYKEQNAAYRERKNQKFARFLTAVGMSETANHLLHDPGVLREEDFNATKTWVEYLNRLVGVAIGLMIIGVVIAGWPVRRARPDVASREVGVARKLFTGAVLLLILVIVQGWFGSIVVSTNLTSWTITVHMFLAIVMVALLVWLMVRSGDPIQPLHRSVRVWALAALAVLLVQVFLGTEVRSMIDLAAREISDRNQWIVSTGTNFVIHRSFSWVVIGVLLTLAWKLRKSVTEKPSYLVPILLLLCSVLTGTAMAWFGVPAAMQPAHLLVAVISIGWTFQLYLQAGHTTTHG